MLGDIMNYLLLSRSNTRSVAMWWRPNAEGYTTNLNDAGLYTEEEAQKHCEAAHGYVAAVEESAAYALATRVIVDMGDGDNYNTLMSPNVK